MTTGSNSNLNILNNTHNTEIANHKMKKSDSATR